LKKIINNKKVALSILVLMLFQMYSLSTFAGSARISNGTGGTPYDISSLSSGQVLCIDTDELVTLTGEKDIKLICETNVDLVLNNISIRHTDGDDTTPGSCAIKFLEGTGSSRIRVEGENNLQSGNSQPSILMPGTTLDIVGVGTLNAIGGDHSTGFGDGISGLGSTINISGGTIFAKGDGRDFGSNDSVTTGAATRISVASNDTLVFLHNKNNIASYTLSDRLIYENSKAQSTYSSVSFPTEWSDDSRIIGAFLSPVAVNPITVTGVYNIENYAEGTVLEISPIDENQQITLTGEKKLQLKGTKNSVNLIFDNVKIEHLKDSMANECALSFTGVNNTLILKEGSNSKLTSGYSQAGIKVETATELLIDGEGTLEVIGGEGGTGIGASMETPTSVNGRDAGRITIRGGRVSSTGGNGSAGIGGSVGGLIAGNGGVITISGDAHVTAQGGYAAAGIGGGYTTAGNGRLNGHGGIITIIDDAVVRATGGDYGVGIGGGCSMTFGTYPTGSPAGTINIGGNSMVRAFGNGASAGIGGGTSKYGGEGGIITITGGTVIAKAGDLGGAGIGGGSSDGDDGIGGEGGIITITGGTVIASGTHSGAGIGGGCGISASTSGQGGSGGTLVIKDSASVFANGGSEEGAMDVGDATNVGLTFSGIISDRRKGTLEVGGNEVKLFVKKGLIPSAEQLTIGSMYAYFRDLSLVSGIIYETTMPTEWTGTTDAYLKRYMATFSAGNHGVLNGSGTTIDIRANENGKVTPPSITPHSGYKFKEWKYRIGTQWYTSSDVSLASLVLDDSMDCIAIYESTSPPSNNNSTSSSSSSKKDKEDKGQSQSRPIKDYIEVNDKEVIKDKGGQKTTVIDIRNKSKISNNFFKTIKRGDKIVARGKDYSVNFVADKETVQINNNVMDLEVTSKEIQGKVEVHFNYEGDFPLKTQLTMALDKEIIKGKDTPVYIYELDEATGQTNIIGYVQSNDGQITFDVPHGGNYFIDETMIVPSGLFKKDIDKISYVSGYGSGKFGADDLLTRAQTTQMIYNIMKTSDKIQNNKFEDIEMWAKDAILQVENKGFVEGYNDKTFKPNVSLTKSDFVGIIIDVFDLHDVQSYKTSDLTDVMANLESEELEIAFKLGLLDGLEENFDPNKTITRAEAVCIINCLIGRNKVEVASENPFVDIDESHWAYEEILKAVQ